MAADGTPDSAPRLSELSPAHEAPPLPLPLLVVFHDDRSMQKNLIQIRVKMHIVTNK